MGMLCTVAASRPSGIALHPACPDCCSGESPAGMAWLEVASVLSQVAKAPRQAGALLQTRVCAAPGSGSAVEGRGLGTTVKNRGLRTMASRRGSHQSPIKRWMEAPSY